MPEEATLLDSCTGIEERTRVADVECALEHGRTVVHVVRDDICLAGNREPRKVEGLSDESAASHVEKAPCRVDRL